MSEVVLHYTRAGKVESLHRADIAFVNLKGEIVDAVGDAKRPMFWRSAAKPFQVLPFVRDGGVEHFGLTQEELAFLVSSHSGEKEHVALAQSVLAKVGLTPEALACGAAKPMSGKAATAVLLAGEKFQAVHNACSGKHSGMLALAMLRGLSIDGYTLAEHTVQQVMHQEVAAAVGLKQDEVELGIDGCGVPVFWLPLDRMAYGYARLAKPEGAGWSADEASITAVRNAMVAYPHAVAGTGRIDTVLMELTKGRLVAKIGSEAVYCLADTKSGLGITFKVEDGSYRSINPMVIGVLKRAGLLTKEEEAALWAKYPPVLKNHRGDIIGTIEILF
ncbi:MAG: asparaginase [Negativicutes bacterium]|nr:asparaginase [Negativicutes bacterium]